jgi:hypothetical protein
MKREIRFTFRNPLCVIQTFEVYKSIFVQKLTLQAKRVLQKKSMWKPQRSWLLITHNPFRIITWLKGQVYMTIVHDKPPRYQSYVLRCLEMRSQHPDRPATWRFILEDPQTREKHALSGLEALVTFLQAELEMQEKELI